MARTRLKYRNLKVLNKLEVDEVTERWKRAECRWWREWGTWRRHQRDRRAPPPSTSVPPRSSAQTPTHCHDQNATKRHLRLHILTVIINRATVVQSNQKSGFSLIMEYYVYYYKADFPRVWNWMCTRNYPIAVFLAPWYWPSGTFQQSPIKAGAKFEIDK